MKLTKKHIKDLAYQEYHVLFKEIDGEYYSGILLEDCYIDQVDYFDIYPTHYYENPFDLEWKDMSTLDTQQPILLNWGNKCVFGCTVENGLIYDLSGERMWEDEPLENFIGWILIEDALEEI